MKELILLFQLNAKSIEQIISNSYDTLFFRNYINNSQLYKFIFEESVFLILIYIIRFIKR